MIVTPRKLPEKIGNVASDPTGGGRWDLFEFSQRLEEVQELV